MNQYKIALLNSGGEIASQSKLLELVVESNNIFMACVFLESLVKESIFWRCEVKQSREKQRLDELIVSFYLMKEELTGYVRYGIYLI